MFVKENPDKKKKKSGQVLQVRCHDQRCQIRLGKSLTPLQIELIFPLKRFQDTSLEK